MTPNAPRNLKIRKILFVSALGLICLSIGFAVFHKAPWIVPEYEKQRKNPLAPSDAAMRSAKQIYADKCANCHGDAGKGDGSEAMMYDPPPADLTDSAKMSKVTDGEIFYQITQGRKPMPSFKNRLTEEQRWQMVFLVRSFPANSAPPNDNLSPPEGKKSLAPSKH
jgi:mono/diheme cytochrome c family protein